MTITIADLQARVTAVGTQQAAQDIRVVGQSAEVTARALELMAAAAAKQSGGTAPEWLKVFQASNVQPGAAALADAARQLERTGAAATQAVTSTRSVAVAAADTERGFRLSESSAVRFAAAIVGVNLGISLVAGAARQIHEQIAGAVDAAHELEVAGRAAAANYGLGARGLGAAAEAFAADPATRGSQPQYIEAVAGMRSLTTQYGLSQAQVQQLVTASGQLARVQGVDLPTAAKALDAVMRGNVNAAESLGVTLTDQAGRLRGVGASYEELVTISGRARAEQVLLAATLQSVQSQQDNTRGSSDNLATALDRLGKASQGARQSAGGLIAGPAAAVAGAAANVLENRGSFAFIDPSMGYATGRTADTLAQTQAARIEGARAAARAMQEERADLIQTTSTTQQNTATLQAQTTAYENLRISINRTVEAIGRIRVEQGQFSTIAEAARGPYFPQVLGSARTIGAATAAQDELALRAQSNAQGRPDPMRAQFELGVTGAQDIGPNAVARAQQLLDQYDRRVEARTQQAQAQHDLSISDLNLAQTQASLTDISIRQRDRELQMQRETIGLRRQDLQLQQGVLAATQGVTQARLMALPVQNAASAFTYQQNMAQALAQQRMGRLLQGKDVSGLPSIEELIQMNVQGQFGAAENAPALLRAQRGVDVAQQGQTAAQLAEQLKAGQLQGAQLSVDLANLGDLPNQTALLVQLNQYERDQLTAQQEERDAVRKLVDLASEPPKAGAGVNTVTVNFSGPVSVRSDQDVADIANQAASMVMDALTEPSSPPAPHELAGARR